MENRSIFALREDVGRFKRLQSLNTYSELFKFYCLATKKTKDLEPIS